MARSKFKEWLETDNLTRIESWASDGLTNEDIAHNMGVRRQTFAEWLRKYPTINDALKKGREPVVREIENALIKKAKGFEYEETTTEIIISEDGEKRQRVLKHKRYSPPDSSAGMFLLKNYKPDKYRNYNELTKRQIEAEIKKIEAEAERIAQEVEESKQLTNMTLIIQDDIARFDEDER